MTDHQILKDRLSGFLQRSADTLDIAPASIDTVRERGHQLGRRRQRSRVGAVAVIAVLVVTGATIAAGSDDDAPLDVADVVREPTLVPGPDIDPVDIDGSQAPMLAGSPGELFAGSVWTIATDTGAPPENPAQAVYRSSDGIAWTVDSITDDFDRVSSIAANDEQLVVVGFVGTEVRVATTQDGITWSTSVAVTLDAKALSNESVPPGTLSIVNEDHVLVLVSSANEDGHAIGTVQARVQTALEERFPEATGPGGFTTDANGTIDGYVIDAGGGEFASGPLTDLLDAAEIETLQNPGDIVTDQELWVNDSDGQWTSTQLDPERTYIPARGLGFATREPATGSVTVTADGETWQAVDLPGLGEIIATPVGVLAITDGSVYRAETADGPFVKADFGPNLSNDRGIRAIRVIAGDGTIAVTFDAAGADAETPIAVLVSDDGLDFRTVAVPPLADPAYWLTPLPGGEFLSQTTATDNAAGTLTIDAATIDPRGR